MPRRADDAAIARYFQNYQKFRRFADADRMAMRQAPRCHLEVRQPGRLSHIAREI